MANIWTLNLNLKNKKDFEKIEKFIKDNIKKTDSWSEYLDFSELFEPEKEKNNYYYAITWFEPENKYWVPSIIFEAKRHIPEIWVSKILKKLNIVEWEFSANMEMDFYCIWNIDNNFEFNVDKIFYLYKEMDLSITEELSNKYNFGRTILKRYKKLLLSWYYNDDNNYHKYNKIEKSLNRIHSYKIKQKELINKFWDYYNSQKILNISQNRLFRIYNKNKTNI